MNKSRSLLLLSALSLFSLSSFAAEENYEFAIPNALRTSAKQPVCAADGETKDGCLFHSRQGDVNRVRLPVSTGTKWVLEPQTPAIYTVQPQSDEVKSANTRFAVIDVIPNKPEDADITLVFDKLETSGAGKVKLVERRKFNIMKHSEKTWNE